MWWEVFEGTTRLLVGALLVRAGTAKLLSTWTWRRTWLMAYQLLPRTLVRPVATLLPAAELTCGVMLLLGALGRTGALAAGLLLGLINVAVVWALWRKLPVDCGCLGTATQLVSWRLAMRNGGLTVAVGLVALHGLTAPGIGALAWQIQAAFAAGAVATVLAGIAHARIRERQRLLTAFQTLATP